MLVLGIVAATIASFIASAILYGLPPVSALIASTSTPRPGISIGLQMAAVAFRSLLVACLTTGLMTSADWNGSASGALLGLALSVIPAVLLLGAVIHEGTPIPTAAIHLLDWTIKLTLIGTIVGLFT